MPIRAQRIARGGRVGRRPLLLLGAAAMLVGGPAFAARKIARIGFIGRGSRQSGQNVLDGFRDGLATLGWAEDGDVALLERWADDPAARLAESARELSDPGAPMLVTQGTPATLAARSAGAPLPTVLLAVGDPG